MFPSFSYCILTQPKTLNFKLFEPSKKPGSVTNLQTRLSSSPA